MIKEFKAHTDAVQQVIYTGDSRWLISAARESLCILNAQYEYQPVKVMHYMTNARNVSISVSPNNKLLANIGPASNICHIYDTDTFEEKHSIQTGSSDFFVVLKFSMNSRELLALTSDNRLLKINLEMEKIVREMVSI